MYVCVCGRSLPALLLLHPACCGATAPAPLTHSLARTHARSLARSLARWLAGARQITSDAWRVRASTTSRLGQWNDGSSNGFGGDAVDDRLAISAGWDSPALNDSDWEQAVPVAVTASIVVSVRFFAR